MLCARSSLKNVAIPGPGPFSGEVDPQSPKIGCMGQVKKRSCRVVGLPTPYRHTVDSNTDAVKANYRGNIMISSSNAGYSKLRKLFSSKSLTGPGTATSSGPSSSIATAIAASRQNVSKSCTFGTGRGNLREAVNIAEMDPPLPVVKKVTKPEEGKGGSLWQRRFGGVAPHLRSLEIQRNSPGHQLRLVTV